MADQYIINKHGVMHSIPDGYPLPAGARKATAKEVEEWKQADAKAKAERLAKVQEERRRAAQLVVVGSPAQDKEPEEKPDKGKKEDAD